MSFVVWEEEVNSFFAMGYPGEGFALFAIVATVGGLSMLRSTQRADVDSKDNRGEFVFLAASPLSASLNPDVNPDEIEAAVDEDAEVIHTSLEELINDLENPDDASSTEDK